MRRLPAAFILVALVAPAAAATWQAGGTTEPDTPYDTAEWMWQDAPPSGASRVYFQVLTLLGAGAGASPNLGLLASRVEPPAQEYHVAILGVWKDCNSDGYVGAAEQGVREYPAALLLGETSVCPSTTGPAAVWRAGAHNYNGWVSELVPIGHGTLTNSDRRVYPDPDAMVWGDGHRPDEPPIVPGCDLLPQGMLESSGGVLNYVSCRFEQAGTSPLRTFNDAMLRLGDPAMLRFPDERDARSGELGQVETIGDERAESSPVYVWDCSSGDAVIAPRVNDAESGSVAGLFNHTYEGTPFLEDCDPSSDYGQEVSGLVEDNAPALDARNKTQAQWNFEYRTAARGGPPLGPALGGGAAGAPGVDGGLGWTGAEASTSGWYSDRAVGTKLAPRLVRTEIETGSVAFPPAYWLTFYAHVGVKTIQSGFELPQNDGGAYGAWACGLHQSGIHSGWNCDATMWYTRTDGAPFPSPGYPVARVGQRYELRDVDCYDGGTSAGVPLGTAWLGTTPCPER